MRKGNMKLMKNINVSLIIREFNDAGPCSRADLTERTGLSPTTITTLIDEMIKKDLIIEIGEGESKGGRRPILLDLNPDHGYILSANISGDSISMALLDLKYNIRDSSEEELIYPVEHNIVEIILDVINKLIKRNNIGEEKIIGLALGWSGIINQENGSVKYSAIMGLRDFPVFESLQEEYSFPVYLENDTNLAALAEKEFGYKDLENYIYVMIGSQVGAGIIIDNNIYRGKFGQAGEFGHIIVEKEGAKCVCGRKGCLTAVLSQYISVENERQFRKQFKNIDFASPDYENFCDYLALALSNYIHLIDTEAVIFGGELVKLAPKSFYNQMKDRIKKYSMWDFYQNVQVLPATLAEDAVIMGGASFCFHNSRYFKREEGSIG
ncbi:MAG: ROK family transcriptional regulator [Firmicutes bacterium]|nr:ROK family transcriptional regulator [Bacillota bacterium]